MEGILEPDTTVPSYQLNSHLNYVLTISSSEDMGKPKITKPNIKARSVPEKKKFNLSQEM